MKQVPDRKKLRQEYLWKRRAHYAAMSGAYVAILMVGCVAFLLPQRVPWTIGLPAVIFLALFTGRQWGMIQQIRHKAKQVPYVPPVTPSTLPAEEILVRGASEPSAPSDTLLRAGVKGEEAKVEELLRSSQGG
jgi:hypothetical protein